jgi:hypothetical protein
MDRSPIRLKLRVRYEGLAQTFDRRPVKEAEAEKFLGPVHRTMGLLLRRQTWAAVRNLTKSPVPSPNGASAGS